METTITTFSGLKYRCPKGDRHTIPGKRQVPCQDCKAERSAQGHELVLPKDMVAGDIVRLTGETGEPFMDMLVTKVELNDGPNACGGKVTLMRPWMRNEPYPMTGHEIFVTFIDSTNCTYWLLRKSESR